MKNYLTAVAIASCVLLTACSNLNKATQQNDISVTNKEIKDYITYKELESVSGKLTGNYCEDAAKYARAMSFLVNAGIPVNSLDDYIVTARVLNFPVRTIQFYVVSNKGNPGQVYDEVFKVCLANGWVNLATQLKNSTPPPIGDLKLTRDLSSKPKAKK